MVIWRAALLNRDPHRPHLSGLVAAAVAGDGARSSHLAAVRDGGISRSALWRVLAGGAEPSTSIGITGGLMGKSGVA